MVMLIEMEIVGSLNIARKQEMILSVVGGDATHLQELYDDYSFVARESWPYVNARAKSKIPVEDLEQQAHLELLLILHNKVLGSGKTGLADVVNLKNGTKRLAMGSFLIRSVRGMLQTFSIEKSNVIQLKKICFEERGKCEECKGSGCLQCNNTGSRFKPPRCVSSTAYHDDETYDLPGAVPIYSNQPEEKAMYDELVQKLRLTYEEQVILEFLCKGLTMEQIAALFKVVQSTIQKKIVKIRTKANRYG